MYVPCCYGRKRTHEVLYLLAVFPLCNLTHDKQPMSCSGTRHVLSCIGSKKAGIFRCKGEDDNIRLVARKPSNRVYVWHTRVRTKHRLIGAIFFKMVGTYRDGSALLKVMSPSKNVLHVLS